MHCDVIQLPAFLVVVSRDAATAKQLPVCQYPNPHTNLSWQFCTLPSTYIVLTLLKGGAWCCRTWHAPYQPAHKPAAACAPGVFLPPPRLLPQLPALMSLVSAHAAIAANASLPLLCYEGGQGMVGDGSSSDLAMQVRAWATWHCILDGALQHRAAGLGVRHVR